MGQYHDLVGAAERVTNVVTGALGEYAERTLRPSETLLHRFLPFSDAAVSVASEGEIRFRYDTRESKVTEVYYSNFSLSNRSDLIRHHEQMANLPDCIDALWEDEFGSQCPHSDNVRAALSNLQRKAELIGQPITVNGVIDALEAENTAALEKLFDTEVPLHSVYEHPDPDLQRLASEEISRIEYRDADLALIIPEHESDGWADELYEAYVVGTDDTDVGLFVHPVAVSPTPVNRDVTRSEIHRAMGFNINHGAGDEHVQQRAGVRLQGDLAIDYLGETSQSPRSAPTQLNLTVDNHLVILESAFVASDSSVDREPIEIVVPSASTIHVLHDEHDQIDSKIRPGRYRLRLLPRSDPERTVRVTERAGNSAAQTHSNFTTG